MTRNTLDEIKGTINDLWTAKRSEPDVFDVLSVLADLVDHLIEKDKTVDYLIERDKS